MAEFRGVNDELLFIKWRETYSGTIQKTEQGDSDLVLQSSQYLHSRRQPWNYTENGIVMSGPLKISVYSHYGTRKSLHPHIIPRKRREAGCVSTGTAARNERVGFGLMKRMILFPWFFLPNILYTVRLLVSLHWDTSCKLPCLLFADVHMRPRRSVYKCWRGGVIKGRGLCLSHMKNHTHEKRFHEQMHARRTRRLMSNQIIIRKIKAE